MITVMIVDDHPVVRTAIKKLLENESNIQVIGEASTGAEALRVLRQARPNIVLLDIDLPDLTGLDIARRLQQYVAETRIIIVTSDVSYLFSRRLLRMGVAGYLLKDCGPQQLLEAISRVHQGQQYLSPEIATTIALRNVENKSGPLDELTDRELELVIRVAHGDQVEKIAEKFSLSTKTINGYRARIFKKLGIKNNVDLMHLALQYGLIQAETLD